MWKNTYGKIGKDKKKRYISGNTVSNYNKDKNILHDTILLLIIALCGMLKHYTKRLINVSIKIIIASYIIVTIILKIGKIFCENEYINKYIYHYTNIGIQKLKTLCYDMIKNIVRYFVIYPIVDTIYPIFDIKTKFDSITANENTYYKIGNCIIKDDIFTHGELTQDMWNRYLFELHKKEKVEYDMFDIMIDQQFNHVNFWITLAINRACSTPRQIPYAVFYTELKNILGEAIDTKYRLVKSGNKLFFVGIFGDDGIYRKFKYFDTF